MFLGKLYNFSYLIAATAPVLWPISRVFSSQCSLSFINGIQRLSLPTSEITLTSRYIKQETEDEYNSSVRSLRSANKWNA